MGRTTKIDWCSSTWNPVTGCYHGCPYCYARGIAQRFGGVFKKCSSGAADLALRLAGQPPVAEIDTPLTREDQCGQQISAPYPLYFMPTLHRYRLDEPQHWKKPRSIFTCSMADLFGEWVPDEWISEVFEACKAAPWHRYLFLTKNPGRYVEICLDHLPVKTDAGEYPAMWFGTTWTGEKSYIYHDLPSWCNRFVSIEPLLSAPEGGDLSAILSENDWVIIGAETGNRKSKVVPHKSWIDRIVDFCDLAEIPVFMKESLREIAGSDFRQEFPWGD